MSEEEEAVEGTSSGVAYLQMWSVHLHVAGLLCYSESGAGKIRLLVQLLGMSWLPSICP